MKVANLAKYKEEKEKYKFSYNLERLLPKDRARFDALFGLWRKGGSDWLTPSEWDELIVLLNFIRVEND